jgi:hypothetical protein
VAVRTKPVSIETGRRSAAVRPWLRSGAIGASLRAPERLAGLD